MSKIKFNREFQLSVLKLMLFDSLFISKCCEYLKKSYFQDEILGWFFNNFKEHYEKHKKFPDEVTILNDIDIRISDEVKEDYKTVFSDICSSNIENSEYIKSKMTEFARTAYFVTGHNEYIELYKKNAPIEEIYEKHAKVSENLYTINFDGDDAINVEDFDSLLKELKDSQKNKITTGIKELDYALLGGMPRQSVTTILAGYNEGKTTFMINVAVEAAYCDKKVLFIYNEGRKIHLFGKFISKISNSVYNEIVSGLNVDEEIRILKQAKSFMENRIVIKEMRDVGGTVENLYSYCKQKKKEFDYDLLVVDYAGNLEVNSKDVNSSHEKMEKIWKTLDQMSAELDCAVLTAAQFNREGVKKAKQNNRKEDDGSFKIVDSSDVGLGMAINKISDTIITINPYGKDKSIVLFVDKTRENEKGQLIKLHTDFSRSMTHGKDLRSYRVSFEDIKDAFLTEQECSLLNKIQKNNDPTSSVNQ